MRRATALVGAVRLLVLCGTANGAIPDPLILRDPEHSEEPVEWDPTVDGAEPIHESGVIQLFPDGPSAGEFGFTSWISQHVKLGKTVVVRFYDTAPTPARHFIGDFLNGVPTEEDLTRLAHNEHWYQAAAEHIESEEFAFAQVAYDTYHLEYNPDEPENHYLAKKSLYDIAHELDHGGVEAEEQPEHDPHHGFPFPFGREMQEEVRNQGGCAIRVFGAHTIGELDQEQGFHGGGDEAEVPHCSELLEGGMSTWMESLVDQHNTRRNSHAEL